MQSHQNQTLALLFILLLVLFATAFATPIKDGIQQLFNYRQVPLDLNPINPNFDWSQLTPKILSSPQQSTQTPNGVAITTDPSGKPLPEPIVVPGAGGDPQLAPGVG